VALESHGDAEQIGFAIVGLVIIAVARAELLACPEHEGPDSTASLVQKTSVTSAPARRTGTMERGVAPPAIGSCQVGGATSILAFITAFLVGDAGNIARTSRRPCCCRPTENTSVTVAAGPISG
jgi:hypothetical protein